MIKAGIVLAVGLAIAGMARAGDPPPLKLYAQPAAAISARLSPDGKRVALVATFQGRQVLYVHSLEEGGKDGKIVRTSDFEIRWVNWKDNDHLIAGVVKATDRLFGDLYLSHYAVSRLVSVDASGDHVLMIGEPPSGFLNKSKGGTGGLEGRVMIHPQIQDEVLSLLPQTSGRVLQQVLDKIPEFGTRVGPAIYSVDIATGRHTLVDPGDERMADYLVDKTGTARLAFEYDKLDEIIYQRPSAEVPWSEIHRSNINGGETFQPLAFLPDNPDRIYVLSNKGLDGKAGLWIFDCSSRQFVQLVDDQASVSQPAEVENGVLISYRREDRTSVYLDPAWQADYMTVRKAVKDRGVVIIDRTADGSHVLLEASAPHKPKVWWMLDRSGKSLNLWPAVEEYPDLADDQVAPVKEITYTARDGLSIKGYLTLPVGYQEGPIPFIVLPHGGPYVCEGTGFDYESQFLASRGWGVLRPEYRGTSCYGKDFERKGFREWGFAMQDDVTDGTHWLIEQKYADPGRICIVGGSYGGYAALEGVTKEPNLYRCAAAWAPVSDLFQLRKAIKEHIYTAVSLDRLGDDDARLDAASPARHADNIKVPVLLMHGKEDFTVDVSQSREMEHTLRNANKPVEAIYLDHADHYRLDAEARTAWLSALDRFLGAQLGKP